MGPMNIYCIGVGGQGIGLLSSALSQACLSAGHKVRGCDTHGLAQRGGTVISHIRLGEKVFTPLVPEGEADLVVSLERFEALRGAAGMLREGGTVVYYDVEYQPIHVRMRRSSKPGPDAIETAAEGRGGHAVRVFIDGLTNPRFQNVALLGRIAGLGIIEGVTADHLREALSKAVPKAALEQNLAVFEQAGADSSGEKPGLSRNTKRG